MRHTGWWNRSTHAKIRAAARGRRMRRLAGAAALATMLACSFGLALAAGEPAKEPKPVNTSAPTVTGTPTVGATLTCSTGVWANNPSGYTYAWLRSGSPIAGQTGSTYVVQSADAGHTLSCQVTASNSGGEYTISGLPSGSYKVDAFAFEGNYLSQWYNGKSLEGEATPVSVTAPGTTSGINAALATGGQITGKVTAAAGGAALANVDVCAEDVKVGHGCATTNSGGEYTIQSLPNGAYDVEFSTFECEEIGCAQQNYLEQSVGGVSVTAGSTTPNINAALAAGGQITGKATAAVHGEPLAKIEVCAEKTGGEFIELFGNCATTNGSGEYTIQGLPTGSYDVEFVRGFGGGNYLPQFYKEEPSLEKATPVAVTAGVPTPNVDAALEAGGQIAGKATAASGGAALANVEVCAALEAGGAFFVSCATTNGGGEYTIPGLVSGEYSVKFLAFTCGENGCVQQNYLEQYVNKVKVVAPSTTEGINAALATGGQITGKVTAASNGAALAEIEVCVGEGGKEFFAQCGFTNAGGEYTISGLPSGLSYAVSFSSFAEEGRNYLPQTDSGVAVTTGSTTANVNAALSPGGQITGRVTTASGSTGLAGVEVCAEAAKVRGGCATTNGGGGSASATSAALAVAGNSSFSLVKAPVFDAKTDDLDFFFQFVEAGTLRWSLYFKNADVGFADSLGLSFGGGPIGADLAAAETAKKKSRRCKQGDVKHKGRCVRTLVPFASGSKSVKAGSVEIEVQPNAKVLKALNAGRTLHVSGQFTFQSALGGPSVTHTVSTVVHGHKKKRKKKGGKKK